MWVHCARNLAALQLRGCLPLSARPVCYAMCLRSFGSRAGQREKDWGSTGQHKRRRCTLCAAGLASMEQAPVESQPEVAYEAVIGIESHVQLSTRTKAFCRCRNKYGALPNTHVCPICLGHPGTLPVLNEDVLKKAVMAGLALDCAIARISAFDRKQYFYPDLPKGYQITQSETPIAAGGSIEVALEGGVTKRIGITRVHLEEDAGKMVHQGANQLSDSSYSLVDYNRAGVPLLEIVTEPDLRSGAEAAAYGAELRRVVTFLGISNGNMQDGSMRCDVNVSVRERGSSLFGKRVEVKNMNSFASMQKAIDFEIGRQVELIRQGRVDDITQETRLFDEGRQETYPMRSKEGLADYRYFPEPDLPAITVTEAFIAAAQEGMAELPAAIRARLRLLQLPPADVLVLADDITAVHYYDEVVAAGAPAKAAANWVMGELMAACKESRANFAGLGLRPGTLAQMLALIEDGTISGKIAKQLLPALLQGEGAGSLREYVEEKGLAQISDEGAIGGMIDGVLAAHPKELGQFRAGKTKLQGYFVGLLMKESQGRANPAIMNRLLMQKLKGS